jgi:hypothetical protein
VKVRFVGITGYALPLLKVVAEAAEIGVKITAPMPWRDKHDG